MFKKILIGSAIAAAMASAPVMAQSFEAHPATQPAVTGSYVALSAGALDLGYGDDPVVLSGTFGVDLDGLLVNLGAEVELTGTVSDGEVVGLDVSYMGGGAYLTYGHNLGQYVGIKNLDGFTRVGLAYGEVEVGSASDDSVDLSYGVGVVYNPQALIGVDGFGVRVEYTDRDYGDSVSAGVTYAF